MPESTVKPDRRALLNAYQFPRWIALFPEKRHFSRWILHGDTTERVGMLDAPDTLSI
jgi:hypothetical protein